MQKEITVGKYRGIWDTKTRKWVGQPELIDERPESKPFPVGLIHKQFDVTDPAENTMWKNFLADDRAKAGGMLEQFITLSYEGIEERKAILDLLAAEAVVADPPYTKIKNVLNQWQTEILPDS